MKDNISIDNHGRGELYFFYAEEMFLIPTTTLLTFPIIISLFLTIIYSGMMMLFIRGAIKLGKQYPDENFGDSNPEFQKLKPKPKPSVSVIVPLRNEEKDAQATLDALLAQDYSGEWEILCVDDRSTDRTAIILKDYAEKNSHLHLIQIPLDAPSVTSPKKRALAAGFAAAKGEILLTTDADCMAPQGWIRSMAECFTEEIGIVQGPKRIRHLSGRHQWISRYQEHEVFGLVSIEAATFALGRPMIASAPSLAYRKELYEKVGGFQGLEDSISGDDDMLVRKMQQEKKWQVRYNPSRDACVTTSPVTSWVALIQQRARWASNGAHYEEKSFVALLSCIYGFYWWLALSPFLVAFGIIPWWTFFLPFLIKVSLSGIFLSLTSKKIGHTGLLKDLLWCEILHVPIVIFAVILGHLGLYRWK